MESKSLDLSIKISRSEILGSKSSKKHFSKICETFAFKYIKLIELSNICLFKEIVREYDQEIPQSQTTDNPVAPRGRAA